MIIKKLKVLNYRDVEERELEFPETGVVIVQGPNDIGKSSLVEAINLVIDEKSSSNKRFVKSIQPYGRDVGSTVELEVKTGAYHFTITKTFNQSKATELEIHTPVVQKMTGDEAHNRMTEMIEETLDLSLWKALRIDQGEGASQVGFSEASWLRSSLDGAAGQTSSGDVDEPIFLAAERELANYFNRRGSTGVLKETETRLEKLENQLADLEGDVANLETDVSASELLEREFTQRSSALDGLEANFKAANVALEDVEQKRLRLARMESDIGTAKASLDISEHAYNERKRLIDAVDKANENFSKLKKEASVGNHEIELLTKRKTTVENLEKARMVRNQTEATRDTYVADLDHLRNVFELGRMKARQIRIDDATKSAQTSVNWLESNLIEQRNVDEINEAFVELEVARAAVESESVTIIMSSVVDMDVSLNGDTQFLSSGEKFTHSAVQKSVIEIPDQLTIEVIPANTADTLAEQLARSEESFAAKCQQIGVDNLDEARNLLSLKHEHESTITLRDQVISDALDDLSLARLEGYIGTYSDRVKQYQENSDSQLALPDGQEAARVLAEKYATATNATLAAEIALVDDLEKLDAELDSHRESQREIDAKKVAAELDVNRLEANLTEVRSKNSDSELQVHFRSKQAEHKNLEEQADEISQAIDALNPKRIELLAREREEIFKRYETEQLQKIRDEKGKVSGRLQTYSRRGIAEAFELARSKHEHTKEELSRIKRRANAAHLLYQVMEKKRSETLQAYIGPLKEAIEEKGSIVFDRTFAVELDEDFSVLERTLGGKSIEVEQIGGGAQEQIAIISRLAVGELVASEGGVPMIFDDVLGFSDPTKLERISAVMSASGNTSQIIVLTCQPERYQQIGSAEVIRLP